MIQNDSFFVDLQDWPKRECGAHTAVTQAGVGSE